MSHITPMLSEALSGFEANHGRGSAAPSTLRFLRALIVRVRWHCMEGFLILGAVLISAIRYRNTSFAELYALLRSLQSMVTRMRDRKLAPYASAFVAVLTLCLMQRSYSPSSLTEPLVVLQDPYQRDMYVPAAFFNSLNILKGFLKDQYAGSNAEFFIRSNLFSITVGRRDGTRLDLSELSDDQQIEPRTRLVMAVLWQFFVQRCPDCDSAINFEVGNWLSW